MSYIAPAHGRVARARGLRGAMGDVVAPAGDPAAGLVAQVNRFGPGAPTGYQFVSEPFSLPMGISMATTALTIYQRRATDAYNQFHDAGSEQAIAAANAGYADPVAFITGHLAEVTQTLQAFADSLGIPPATSGIPPIGPDGGPILIGAVILAVWWLMERKR